MSNLRNPGGGEGFGPSDIFIVSAFLMLGLVGGIGTYGMVGPFVEKIVSPDVGVAIGAIAGETVVVIALIREALNNRTL